MVKVTRSNQQRQIPVLQHFLGPHPSIQITGNICRAFSTLEFNLVLQRQVLRYLHFQEKHKNPETSTEGFIFFIVGSLSEFSQKELPLLERKSKFDVLEPTARWKCAFYHANSHLQTLHHYKPTAKHFAFPDPALAPLSLLLLLPFSTSF